MSKTRFVAFATQKGGIGKSTITALVANYFHNVKGYNVAVIDCDEPQYNLADLRDEELELIKSSDYFKAQACEHFKKLGKKSFSVTRSNAVNALDDAETVLNETEVKLDFIFFDMPGTIKSEGVMKTLSQMDYIFVPVSADRFVVESAMSFMQLFHDNFSVLMCGERYRWKSRKALAMLVFPEQSSKILFVAKSFPSSLLIFSPLYASAPYNELPKLIFATIFPQTYGLVQQSHG